MTEPTRLLHEGSSLSRALLNAGTSEEPSDEALARTLAALGAGAIALGTAAAAGGAGTALGASHGSGLVAVTSIAKWIGIGAALGAVTVGAAEGVRHLGAPEPAAVTARGAPAALVDHAVPPTRAPERALAAAEPAASEAPAAPSSAPQPASKTDAPGPAGRLDEEVAQLDRARSALRRGDASAALAAVAEYRRRFSAGTLSQEARLIELDALEARGDHAAASAAARSLLESSPDGPHAARARAVLGQ